MPPYGGKLQTINGMMKLLEKYYNINYYCAYKLLFFILNRMLNPFYWLSFSKWKNGYINRCISINKQINEPDKGDVDAYISDLALSTPITISFWIFSLVCLACSKILSVQLVRIILENDIIFYSLLVVFCICGYYVNEIFLLKMKYSCSSTTNTGSISPSSIKRKGICSTTASMSFP